MDSVSSRRQEQYLFIEEYAEPEFQLPFFVLALQEYVARFDIHPGSTRHLFPDIPAGSPIGPAFDHHPAGRDARAAGHDRD